MSKAIFLFRKIFFRILYFAGIGHLLKYCNQQQYHIPILLFHRVSEDPDPYWPPLSNKAFRRIINFFGDKYEFRPLSKLSGSLRDLRKSCIIVFDDGYKDFYENVIPFFNEKNIPVTMFIPVESVETGKPIWTTKLNMWIDGATINQLTITDEGKKVAYDLSSPTAKIRTAVALLKWLKSLTYKKNIFQLNEILKQTGENRGSMNISVMSWAEINQTKDKVDYQSHTITHPMLSNIQDSEDLKYEIGEAKKRISDHTGIFTNCISYPIGSYSEIVMNEAKKHYDLGFAVDERLVDLKKMNDPDYRYRIPRFNVSHSDPYELFFRVNGFHKLFGR